MGNDASGPPPPLPRPRRARRPFFPSADFPELLELQRDWAAIRPEARLALDTVGAQLGIPPDKSWILPLVPEYEDRQTLPEEACARARELAPVATRLASAVPYLLAFAFSKLTPGAHIPSHEHWNPYLTALLCLQDGGGGYFTCAGERHDFVDGNLVVFDYTLPHESWNHGTEDRLVMLLLIDRARAGH